MTEWNREWDNECLTRSQIQETFHPWIAKIKQRQFASSLKKFDTHQTYPTF